MIIEGSHWRMDAKKISFAITGINYVLNAALVNRRDFFQKYKKFDPKLLNGSVCKAFCLTVSTIYFVTVTA